MVASACQWLGVAMETASISLDSNMRAHVREVLGLVALRLLNARHGAFARGLVHVAHGGDAAIRRSSVE